MILLEKEKIKYYEFYEQDCLDKYIDITEKRGLIKSLTDQVVFAKDLTFKDFFNHLLREKKDLNKAFFSTMRGYKIGDYVNDINTSNKKKKDTQIASVQVGWRVEIKENELEIVNGFHGVSEGENGNRENAVETIYGISMTPLHEYANFPFRLNENFIIEDYRKKTFKEVLKSKKPFTLFEVIHAVLYEITWDGKPKERDKRLKKLKKRIKQSEKDIAAGNYITGEELKKKLKERFSKNAKPPLSNE